MKKIFTALALATLAISASATGLVVEGDWNHYQGKPDGYNHNVYGYVGLIQSTSIGTFDAGIQGVRTYASGVGVDRANGFEVGYSYPFQAYGLTFIPRVAYGSMAHINPKGTGYDLHARYWMPSLEVDKALTSTVGTYVSFSHMNGVNADSIARANRVQAGLDFSLTKDFVLRTGYSFQHFGDTVQSGVVVVGTYSF